MLLESKTAIVYGASGAVGSEVARTFARQGAAVHLVSRTSTTLESVAIEIRDDGGVAHVAALDVLDRDAVRRHAEAAAGLGGIDVCFNAVGNDDVQGAPVLDIAGDEVLRPVTKALTVHLNIAAAVSPHMIRQGGGVILAMAGGREAIPRLGGSHVAWAALAGLCRQLAADLGQHGVRVSWLLSPGSPDGGKDDGARDAAPLADGGGTAPPGTNGLLPRHLPSYVEVANFAAFIASDWARTMTATEINLTGGAVID